MLDRLAQRRQQALAFGRRIVAPLQQQPGQTAITVTLPQQLRDQNMRTIGLVLVDEGGRGVAVKRDAILVEADHLAAGQIGGIAGTRSAVAGSTDLDRAVGGGLGDKAEAVIEVLAKGHQEDVGVVARLRQACLLTAEDVRNRARIEPVEDRVERAVVDRRVVIAVARFSQADEGLVSTAVVRISCVVAGARNVAHSESSLSVIVVGEGRHAVDELLHSFEIARAQGEGSRSGCVGLLTPTPGSKSPE